MTYSVQKLIPMILICALTVRSLSAQQPPSLSKHASDVKAKVDTLSPQARISVIPIRGEEEFGNFRSRDQEHFAFYDIDRKTDVSFRYEEVRKVKDGYGGYNHLRGRHTDRTKAIVVGAVLVSGLVGLIIAAALARN